MNVLRIYFVKLTQRKEYILDRGLTHLTRFLKRKAFSELSESFREAKLLEKLMHKQALRLKEKVWLVLQKEIMVGRISRSKIEVGINSLSRIVSANKREVFEILKKKKR